MRYSQEFKDNVVARLLSKELSISEAVKRYSIGKSTISYWLKIAREQAVCGTLPNKGNPKLMTSLKLPKGVTYLQAHTAVVAREIMSEIASGGVGKGDQRFSDRRFVPGFPDSGCECVKFRQDESHRNAARKPASSDAGGIAALLSQFS